MLLKYRQSRPFRKMIYNQLKPVAVAEAVVVLLCGQSDFVSILCAQYIHNVSETKSTQIKRKPAQMNCVSNFNFVYSKMSYLIESQIS